jgi:hypothetical protein
MNIETLETLAIGVIALFGCAACICAAIEAASQRSGEAIEKACATVVKCALEDFRRNLLYEYGTRIGQLEEEVFGPVKDFRAVAAPPDRSFEDMTARDLGEARAIAARMKPE